MMRTLFGLLGEDGKEGGGAVADDVVHGVRHVVVALLLRQEQPTDGLPQILGHT
jgi:hypothetical protein